MKLPSLSNVKNDLQKFPAGKYIVTLKDAPAATYAGGVSGYAATKPTAGRQLDAKDGDVKEYRKYLSGKQKALAAKLGINALYNYTLAYNGFAAELTPGDAARLAKSPSVEAVTPNEILKIQAESSTDFLKISTAGGLWDKVGGVSKAGKGVVVGVLDTGIAPENPSFAAPALTTSPSTNRPYLSGNQIIFQKNDGNTFSSSRQTGEQFANDDYSEKIVGARYYLEGFGEANLGNAGTGEYVSPRDGDSHGSHTASTAAGNANVEASAAGQDFGLISGVAPAAKISSYKVCWSGPDPDVQTDDGCATTDLVAGIEQAVADGVDVINYSIGGGAADTVYSPTDRAFLNAASAGIFVSASAGNDGPGDSTLDNASPWVTTVAASTIPSYEATIVLGNGTRIAGASISVDRNPANPEVSGPLVLASSIPADGATVEDAGRCFVGSLNPAGAAGKIVVCDRGVNPRVEKSQVAADAGAIGAIIVNVTPGDTVTDDHSIPTIHVDAQYRTAIRTYAATDGATATLKNNNLTGNPTPVPQLAGFSSRGPVLAAGGDVMKPDVAAPGVSILAAAANAEGGDPAWEFLSGTSMAAPHVAGLAAVYFGVHPLASPSEIKSALATTATDTVGTDNKATRNPFGQGAGQVNPSRFLNPGMVYLSGINDWKRYLVGTGEAKFDGVTAIDPSNLNLPSIAIGDLAGKQTVTRSVTSTGAGTWTAKASIPGITTTVSPAKLVFTAAGQTKKFTVTFTRTTAALDEYATGFLVWDRAYSSAIARSPLAVHPTAVQAPDVVRGEGTSGRQSITITPGANGVIPIQPEGLAEGIMTPNASDPELPYTAIADDANEFADEYEHEVLAGTSFARFDVQPVEVTIDTDLDLELYYSVNGEAPFFLVDDAFTSGAGETIDVVEPDPGFYYTVVYAFSTPEGGAPYTDVAYLLNPATDVGNLTAIPSTINGRTGVEATFDLRWGGLTPNASFLGFVYYGDAEAVTDLYVETGDALAPVSVTKPSIEGTAAPGETVTVDPGAWDADNEALAFAYQWLADGDAIEGATGETFNITEDLIGKDLSVFVSATLADGGPAKVVASAAIAVKAPSATTFTFTKNPITTSEYPRVNVTVVSEFDTVPTGTVTVKYGVRTLSATLEASDAGVISIRLPKLSNIDRNVTVYYRGSDTVAASVSAPKKLVIR